MTNSTIPNIIINTDALNAYVALGKLEQAACEAMTNEKARDFVQRSSELIFDALPFSPETVKLDKTRIIDVHMAVDELEYAASLNIKDPREDQRIAESLKAIHSALPPNPVITTK